MSIINNRYRIISPLNDLASIPSYLVKDALDKDKEKIMHLLDFDAGNNKLLDFYSREFALYKNLTSPFILNNYAIEPVKTIGGKQVGVSQYALSSQYTPGSATLHDTLENLAKQPQEKLLQLFVQACCGVSFLHVKNICHGDINANNIVISKDDGYTLCLRDMATVRLLQAELGKNAYFTAPEGLYGTMPDAGWDIYSLGVVLFCLVSGKNGTGASFKKELADFAQKPETMLCSFASKILPIIEKATADKETRFKDVASIIHSINNAFGTQYKTFNPAELEYLSLGTSFIGRRDELGKILKNFERFLSSSHGKALRYVYVNGEQGVGKSTLFGQIKDRLYLQNAPVFWCLDCHGDNAVRAILRQLAEGNFATNADGDFLRYISSVINGTALDESSGSYGRSSLIKFIYDCVKDKEIIFMLDDFEFADDFSINLFETLLSVCKKLCLLFTSRPSFDSEKFGSFLEKLRSSEDFIHFRLAALSKEETAALVKGALNMPQLSDEFAQTIHKNTNGNPLFLEDVLKNLHTNRIIYVKESDGRWHINYQPSEYDKIPMPASLEQFAQATAQSLNQDEFDVAEAVSIFNNIFPSQGFLQAVLPHAKNMKQNLNNLVNRGILNEFADGQNVTYDLDGKLLKSYLYNQIKTAKVKGMHSLAADALEGHSNKGGDMLAELVLHLELAGRSRELLPKYQQMIKEGMRIGNLTKCVEICRKMVDVCILLGDREEEAESLYKLGNTLKRAGKIAEGIDFLRQGAQLCKELGLTAKYVKIQCDLVQCLQLTGNRDGAWAAFEEMESHVNFDDDFRQTNTGAYVTYLISNISLLRQKDGSNQQLKEMIENALSFCKDDMFTEKASLANSLYTYHYANKNFEKAIEFAIESIRLCLLADSRMNAIVTQGNLSIIYSVNRKGKLSDVTSSELLQNPVEPMILPPILNSKARNHYSNFFEIDKAIDYAEQFIVAAKMAQRDPYVMGFFTQIPALFNAGFISDAYGVATNFKTYVDGKKIPAESILLASQEIFWFYMSVGDFEAATHAASKILEIQPTNQRFQKEHEKLLRIASFVKEISTCDGDYNKTANQAEEMVKELVNPENLDAATTSRALDFLFWVHRYKGIEPLSKSLTYVLTLAGDLEHISMHLRPKILYAESLMQQGDKRLTTLKKAYQLAPKKKMPLLLSLICNSISLFHSKTSEYLAKDYAARACEAIRESLSKAPEKFWGAIVQHYNFEVPFRKVINSKEIAINQMMSEGLFGEFLADEKLKTLGRQVFLAGLPLAVRSPHGLLANLSSDIQRNLSLFVRYFAASSCAHKCLIITKSDAGDFSVIASNINNDKGITEYLPILHRTEMLGQNVLVCRDYHNGDGLEGLLSEGINAALCMPVNMGQRTVAYVYISADSMFHNINQKSAKGLDMLLNPLAMNVHMHTIRTTAMLDKLTGALNRQYLEIAMDKAIQKAVETGSPLSIIVGDLDNFKAINDTYGHQTGDAVLREFGAVIRNNLRKDTPFGRFGGEEFVVVLEGAKADEALRVSEKLRLAIDEEKLLGIRRPVTASFGIAALTNHDTSKAGLMEKADMALYASKKAGRNTCTVYDAAKNPARDVMGATDIVSGDTIIDAMRMRMTFEIINLIKDAMPHNEKTSAILGKIKEIARADDIFYLTASEIDTCDAHKDLIKSAIYEKQPKVQRESGGENAEAIAAIPCICGNVVMGALCLTALPNNNAAKLWNDDLLQNLGNLACLL
ncbi:MAG: diguanylate cyclase [Defluviitaleaceae bacterium]|nr:diguanylate cyclase [Defluviitaleaceae bacterium]